MEAIISSRKKCGDGKVKKKIGAVLLVIIIALALGLPTPIAVSATSTIYVDADASGLNNGDSWENAYTDLARRTQ